MELKVSRWLVPEVPTGPSGPLLSCIPATYHHLFQSATHQARSTCRVGQPWTPPTPEIIHLHTSPFLCLYLTPPCRRQKDSGELNDRKRHGMPLFIRVKHDASGSFHGRTEALKSRQTEKSSHLWRHQLWGDLVWHVPQRHPLRVCMETVYQDREVGREHSQPLPWGIRMDQDIPGILRPPSQFQEVQGSGVCAARVISVVSRWSTRARGQCTLSCPPYARHVCFPILKSREGLGKNAAGRMPNLGRSLVYSPGRMKATHITNSFALSSPVICCFSPLHRFQHTTSVTWNRIQQQLGLLKASEAQQNEKVSYIHPGEA